MEPNLLSLPNATLAKHFEDPLNSNNLQVSDFPQSLETAEDKCGTLKQHLDYMKMLYQGSTDYLMNSAQNIPTISNYNQQEFNEKLIDESNERNIVNSNYEKNQQEENCSKKVKVIKNILTGINKTVDRISKLSTNGIKPNRTKRSGKSHSRESLKSNKHKHSDKLIPKNKNHTNRPSTSKLQKKNKSSQDKKIRKSYSNRTLCSLNNEMSIKKYKEEYEKKYPNKIIEIYHNDALKLKGSPSDEQCIENKPRSKNIRVNRNTPKCYEDEIPRHETSPNSLIKNENEDNKVPVKMTGHFLTPTFSSKQRQVDRSLFNENSKLSFNKIPFVAGMATTQSHNLGMNIQQVLSIIKLKQQLQQSDSQIHSGENLNAKSSDEQDKVSEGKTLKNSSLNRQRNISNYEQILSNYIKDSRSLSFLKDDKVKRFSILNYQSSQMINNLYENDLESEALNIQYLKPKFYRNIKGRIRGIREVLNSLYADYLRLNRIYKRIYQEIVEEHYIDFKVLKSLEFLEEELQAKEDEISVVMCLFKQVIELKEQVSTLRHQTMQMDLPIREQPVQEGSPDSLLLSNRRYKKDSTATVRLTRLLRTIQKFHNKLKYQDLL